MKTFYNYRNKRDALSRKAVLEAQTGLIWDAFLYRGGWMFTPLLTSRTEAREEIGRKLWDSISYLPGGSTFVRLSEETGIPLADVISGAAWLLRGGYVSGQVNVKNHCIAVRRRRKGEAYYKELEESG